jgi:hypothetical protein
MSKSILNTSSKQKQSHRIVVIICYIGKLPWYFNYFIHSCAFNPTIDFCLIINDQSHKTRMPRNVTVHYKELHQIQTMASAKLGFQVALKKPYKLCDFKPAYGVIFKEFINGYDHWGFGDIDVIYGNIRSFITPEILQSDVISARHDYLTGHFCLFKNCKKINALYTQSKDYKKVFTSEKNFCFDETNYAFYAFTSETPLKDINTEIESMTYVVKKLASENRLTAHFDFMLLEGTPGRMLWKKGKLFYRRRFEVMMYHLIQFKTIYKPSRTMARIPDRFRISDRRIYRE